MIDVNENIGFIKGVYFSVIVFFIYITFKFSFDCIASCVIMSKEHDTITENELIKCVNNCDEWYEVQKHFYKGLELNSQQVLHIAEIMEGIFKRKVHSSDVLHAIDNYYYIHNIPTQKQFKTIGMENKSIIDIAREFRERYGITTTVGEIVSFVLASN